MTADCVRYTQLLRSPLLSPPNTASALSTIEFKRKRMFPLDKSTQLSRRSIEVAVVYVEDAICVRRPQTRIQQHGIKLKICSHRISLSPLQAYTFVHNKWWKLSLYILLWINLFYMDPSRMNALDTWVLITQFVCLICFIMDCALSVFSHDKEFLQTGWQRMLYLVIILNTVHLVWLCMSDHMPHNINLLLQVLRPYYLIYYGRSVRNVFKGILRSIPRIIVLVWVIACTISCFGWIGYQLFSDIPRSNFNTFEDSMLSLMILLTTANFPDVMMPAYHSSQFYVLFFALFIVTILILFLPTLLAVIYEAYHSQTQKRYEQIVKTHQEALWRAFELLTQNKETVITEAVWMQFMRIMRPDLDCLKHEVLYTTLRLTEEDLTCPPDVVENRLRAEHSPHGITKEQWLRLPEFIEIQFRVSRKADQVADGLVQLQNRLSFYLAHRETRTVRNKLKALSTDCRVYLIWMFGHVLTDNVVDWMVWMNAMCFIAEKCTEDVYHNHYGRQQILHTIHLLFLCIFVLEMVLKMYAFGCKTLISDKFFGFDACLVFIGLIGWYCADKFSVIQLIRCLRLLRVLIGEFPQFRLLMKFLSALMRAFVILLLAQLCVFYLFCMIGMVLFDGMIGYEQIVTEMQKYNSDDALHWYWSNHLDGEDATLRYYYLNNFNSFIAAMIVLMELSVVNNWHCLMQMYITMSDNHYLRIFFIAFYGCAVCVMLNVLIAFVINLFLVNYGQNISHNDLLFRYKRYILMSILMHTQHDIYHWTIERRIRNHLWYQIIFEQQKHHTTSNIDYDEVIQMPFVHAYAISEPLHHDQITYNDKSDHDTSTADKPRSILINRSILTSLNNCRSRANTVSILSQTESESQISQANLHRRTRPTINN